MSRVVAVTLEGPLEAWAKKQQDPEAAISKVLASHAEQYFSPYNEAVRSLEKRIPQMDPQMDYGVNQLVGSDLWGQLSRSERIKLGLDVKGRLAELGLVAMNTPGTHGRYRRAAL